ncbi:hypothetical protein HAX54_032949 [Datura stramonium]|uniref:Uncharacterized protein n=1 Tax=Datura stramonium TaxID=4076 RepID=A0ABS8VF79_DATST|nr:hypothetical protein [Datura stramonium]
MFQGRQHLQALQSHRKQYDKETITENQILDFAAKCVIPLEILNLMEQEDGNLISSSKKCPGVLGLRRSICGNNFWYADAVKMKPQTRPNHGMHHREKGTFAYEI